jgi:hypothetical protein
MVANRMNRDEFYATMAPSHEARLCKILWTLYWRGDTRLRERIEGEVRPLDQPNVKQTKEVPAPDRVLDEVTAFVKLARDGAYMAGDRRGTPHRTVPVATHVPPAGGRSSGGASSRQSRASAASRRVPNLFWMLTGRDLTVRARRTGRRRATDPRHLVHRRRVRQTQTPEQRQKSKSSP